MAQRIQDSASHQALAFPVGVDLVGLEHFLSGIAGGGHQAVHVGEAEMPGGGDFAKGGVEAGQSLVGKKGLQTTGYVKPGSLGPASAAQRFVLAEKADGSGKSVAIKYSGALPETVKDGVQVVVSGTLESDQVFDATAVALSQGQK